MKCDFHSTIIPLPEVHLFVSASTARAFISGRNCDPNLINDETAAQTVCDCDNNSAYVVLNIRSDISHTAAILAHEAYHVACFAFEQMQEEEPGEEITAYLIQAIHEELVTCFLEYARRDGRDIKVLL